MRIPDFDETVIEIHLGQLFVLTNVAVVLKLPSPAGFAIVNVGAVDAIYVLVGDVVVVSYEVSRE